VITNVKEWHFAGREKQIPLSGMTERKAKAKAEAGYPVDV
jgi:hypothetical protein